MPRRRLAITVVLLLVAGAVINVGVAWTLHTQTIPGALWRISDPRAPNWLGWAPPEWPAVQVREGNYRLGASDEVFSVTDYYSTCAGNRTESFTQRIHRRGLPLRSLATVTYSETSYSPITNASTYQELKHPGFLGLLESGFPVDWFLATNPWTGLSVRAPIRPIFPAFLANTAFYAALLALPVLGLPALRRTRRRRRGLCPKCAYDLRETPDDHPCPECGSTPSRKSISPRG